MSEQLSTAPVTYVKLKEVGDTVAGVFDSLLWDVMGTFGKESSVRLLDPDGNVQQVRLATTLVSTLKGAEKRLVSGKSHLTITLTGEARSKKDASKTYKVFDVVADGLLPKDGSAPAESISPATGLRTNAPVDDPADIPF